MVKRKTAKKKVAKKKTIKRAKTAKKPARKVKKAVGRKVATKKVKKRSSEQYKTMALLNEKLSHLEAQAQKAYECVQAARKRSTPDWKKWVNKLSKQDWLALAGAQRDRISSEVKHLSDEIVSKINDADILTGKNGLVHEAKQNLDSIIKKIDHGDIVDKAVDTAINTKDGLLAFLNIPTHDEMAGLQKKLKSIEKRLTQLGPRSR